MPYRVRTAQENRETVKNMENEMYSHYSSLYSHMITGNARFLRNDTISLTAACGNFALHSHDDRAFESLKLWVKSVKDCLHRSELAGRYYKLIATNHIHSLKLCEAHNSSIESDYIHNRSCTDETTKLATEKNESMQERNRLLCSMDHQLGLYKKEETKRNFELVVEKKGETLQNMMLNGDLAHPRETVERLQVEMHNNYSFLYFSMLKGNEVFLRDDTVSLMKACDNFASKSHDDRAFECLKSWVKSVDICRDRLALTTMYYNLIAANYKQSLKVNMEYNLLDESSDKHNVRLNYKKKQLAHRKHEYMEERKGLVSNMNSQLILYEEENKKRNNLREVKKHQASVRDMLLHGNLTHHGNNAPTETSPMKNRF